MSNPFNESVDRRLAGDAKRDAHWEAVLALGASGETGQRVVCRSPVNNGRMGTIIGWEEEDNRRTAVVRLDGATDPGDDVFIAPEYLERI